MRLPPPTPLSLLNRHVWDIDGAIYFQSIAMKFQKFSSKYVEK